MFVNVTPGPFKRFIFWQFTLQTCLPPEVIALWMGFAEEV